MTKSSLVTPTTAATGAIASPSRQVSSPTSPSTAKRSSHVDDVTTSSSASSPPPYAVPTNEFGGVLVTPDQIHAAFQFLDLDKKNRVTPENLRARLGLFYDQLSMKDIKLLLHDQHELTEDYLTALLLTNEVTHFDPVLEAFKAYDPEETGFIAKEMLRFVFERMGFGALTDEDLNVLVACADQDGDGRIGLGDFRSLLQPQ